MRKVELSLSRLHEELAPIYETVRVLSASLPSNVTLIGYAGAPWTVATYMVEGRGGGQGLRTRSSGLNQTVCY